MDRAPRPFGNNIEEGTRVWVNSKIATSQWAMAECTYLGHIVGVGYVKLEINKLEAVENFPVPKTKKEVWSFLGLTGYYRHFIKDYESITGVAGMRVSPSLLFPRTRMPRDAYFPAHISLTR